MEIKTTKVFRKLQTAYKSGATIISAQGSSRSSKTYNILIWLILYCLQNPYTRLSIVRKTLPAIKGSVFIDFKEILINMGIWNGKSLNKTELIYQLPNGSWVEFFSTDNEQKLRGRKRDVLFVNEANELAEIEWQQLVMRTTRLSVLDYNPSFSDEHWLCKINKESKTHHFITTYKDNPFLEQVIIDNIESLKYKNPTLWQVYGLGLQAMIEGLVFKTFETVPEIPARIKRRYYGMDFGFTADPTAIVEVAVEGDDIYLHEHCYKTQMLTSDIIAVLKKLPQLKVISECADPRLVQEIYRAGINIHPVKKYAGSVEAGLSKMQEFNIHVTERSTNIIKELKNYTYQQDKEGKWLNSPIDAFNHAIDGSRYVVLSEILGGERKPINKRKIAGAVY